MKKVLLGLVALIILAALSYFSYDALIGSRLTVDRALQAATVAAALTLTQEYTNDVFRFSFKMPGNFVASEVLNERGATTLLFQDTSGEGIQVVITPFDEDLREITKERIEQDNPNLAISEAQVVEIGNEDRGLAFKSDNPAFGGDSRDVWFVYPACSEGACEPMLYQISTYGRLDPLLKAVFATWKFF